MLVFPNCRNNTYTRQLSEEICSGMVDLEHSADCKLLSAMSRKERRALDEKSLKAYDIDALRLALYF